MVLFLDMASMVSMAHLPESSGLIGVMALASMVGMARMVGLTGTVWPLTLPPFTLHSISLPPFTSFEPPSMLGCGRRQQPNYRFRNLGQPKKAGSTLRTSQAAPHPRTNRAMWTASESI